MSTKEFLFIVLIPNLFTLTGFAQADSLFSQLNIAQKQRLKVRYYDTNRLALLQFDTIINQLFRSTTTCKQLPDTSNHSLLFNELNLVTKGKTLAYALMHNIVIIDTGNLRVYSWDNSDGGSYHTYTNYIQFKDKDGNCRSSMIDTLDTTPEVGYYNIEQIENYYLIFGFGTYGGGKNHFVVKQFKNENGKMLEYHQGYPNGKIIKIESNRRQNIELKFNRQDNTITYKAFEFDHRNGFYSDKFKWISLEWKNGNLIYK